MIRETAICTLAVLLSLAAIDRAPAAFALNDGFDRGIGRGWAVRQEQDGRLNVIGMPGHGGVLRAMAAPKGDRVTKAALIARPAPIRTGGEVTVAFDLRVPTGTPLNSIQLVDIECATCGEGGNPGIRLYLRRGRLRIDRSKIGIRDAWTNEAAPQLSPDRWYRIGWRVRLGADGQTRVTVDGREVLAARGATMLPGSDHVDRVQIGITANSNAVPATLLVDNVAIRAR